MNESVHLEEVPYCPDGCELFERIRDMPRPAFLDSSSPHASAGRYDILTAQPLELGLPIRSLLTGSYLPRDEGEQLVPV